MWNVLPKPSGPEAGGRPAEVLSPAPPEDWRVARERELTEQLHAIDKEKQRLEENFRKARGQNLLVPGECTAVKANSFSEALAEKRKLEAAQADFDNAVRKLIATRNAVLQELSTLISGRVSGSGTVNATAFGSGEVNVT